MGKSFWKNSYVFKVLNSFYWFFSSAILTQSILFITQIIAVRTFSVEDVGSITLITTNVGLIALCVLLGIGTTVSKYISDYLNNENETKHEHVVTGSTMLVIVSIVTFTIVAYVLIDFLKLSKKISGDVLLCILVGGVTYSIDGLLKSILIGHNAKKFIIFYGFFSVISYPLNVLFLNNLLSYSDIYLLSFLLHFIIAVFCFLFFCIQYGKLENYLNVRESIYFVKKTFFKSTLPAFLSGLLVLPTNAFIQWYIFLNLKNGNYIVAIMGIGLQWFNIIQFLPMYFSKALISHSSSSADTDFNESYSKIVKLNLIVCFSITCVFVLIADFVDSIYSISDVNLYYSVVISIISAFFKSISSPYSSLIIIKEKMWIGMGWNFAWSFVYVSTFLLFFEKGIVTIMMCFLFAYISQFFMSYFWYRSQSSSH